jgi:DNA segregation ATPase FtsK/SpoIIIE-like protein
MKKTMVSHYWILLLLAIGFASCKDNPAPQTKAEVKEVKKDQASEPEPPVIGRITFVEKNVFRYLSDAKDWTLAMVDIPVSDGDVLYSDTQGRSELTFPNDTTLRLNDKTKIQLDSVKGNLVALFVNSGIARVQNRSADTTVKVDTPYGQVLSNQPGAFDVYVGDSSVAVTALKQPLKFVDGKGTSYDINPDASTLLATDKAVVPSPRFMDSSWDSWNIERDKEIQVATVEPSPYLPTQLQSDSKVLNDNGAWEQLSYNGETAHYWTPRNVSPDWSPFTVGQWTMWNGEQLWVPYERFGWVTHHHGGWIHYNGHWYWRPGAPGRYRYAAWYPARVAWIHSGRHIGWVPISHYEAYYGRRYWGPRSVVYYPNGRYVEFRNYVNANRVVVIEKERLYGVHRRYETSKDASVVKEVVSNGRTTPVVTRDVVGGNSKMEQHFARSGDFSRKPNVDGTTELASRRRNSGDATVNAQPAVPEVQKASLKNSADRVAPIPALNNSSNNGKRNLPETPRDLRREQRQERRLDASTGKTNKEASVQQPLQQQKQLPQRSISEIHPQQPQRLPQESVQRRQQQFERQQQQQLMQEQQRAQRAQQQQQLQAQRQQQQLAQQQQQAQRQQQQVAQQQQQQAQRQQQQVQQRHAPKQAQR